MRYLEDETTWILGNFTTGDTVTITIYKLSDNSKVVDAAACAEVATTGRFKYSFSQAVAAKTEYLWIMTNSIEEQNGKIILGGYPDGIKDQTDKMNFTGTDIKATLDGEKVALTDATEAQIDAIETDTNEMQGKLPTNNIMGSSVKTDKDDEIDAIETDTNEMQSKLPNDNIAGSVDKTSLENKHGSGSWEGTTPAAVADAVWDEPHSEHEDEATFGGLLKLILEAARKVFIPIRRR